MIIKYLKNNYPIMLKEINESVKFLNKQTNCKAGFGIILGTGLGGLVEEIEIEKSISYEEIPNFPISTDWLSKFYAQIICTQT